jgi:hypothetical protein
MSAVALLDVSGAEQQWHDIMFRFPSLPLATDVEEPLEATASQSIPESSTNTSSHMQAHGSGPAPALPEAGLPLTPHSAFAQAAAAAGAGGISGGTVSHVSNLQPAAAAALASASAERRGMVPIAAAVVERVRRAVQDKSPTCARQSVSFQENLESASMLLAQVVSLGCRLTSSATRLQGM